MGIITIIALSILVLAVIGLGTDVFLSGVAKGIEKIENTDFLEDMSQQAAGFADMISDIFKVREQLNSN